MADRSLSVPATPAPGVARVHAEFPPQRNAFAVDLEIMLARYVAPGYGLVVYRVDEVYSVAGWDDSPLSLIMRRRLGLLRLARVVEDQLGVTEERALCIAARIAGGVAQA